MNKFKKIFLVFSIIAGFLSPTYELICKVCSESFFDPLPSIGRILLFYSVPVSIALSMYLLLKKKDQPKVRLFSQILIIYAATVSLAYSILFFHVMICGLIIFVSSFFSIFGVPIVFFMFTVPAITPICLFSSSLLLSSSWNQAYLPNQEIWKRFRSGAISLVLASILFLFFTADLWILSYCHGLLASSEIKSKKKALELLQVVERKEFRKACFGLHKTNNPFPFGHTEFLGEAFQFNMNEKETSLFQSAYYFLYGEQAAAGTIEPGLKRTRWNWDIDDDIGGDVVGSRQESLFLKESALSCKAQCEENIAFTEWTLIFINHHKFAQKEARAVIHLPPYGVVSKVSLWLGDEERPAAFGSRKQVKEAYRKVVAQKRDPLLVNMIGQDIVQIQCFPILPRGGTMKIRLGITYPLLEQKYLKLPYFVETNFTFLSELKHSIQITSDYSLKAWDASLPTDKTQKLKISDKELRNPAFAFSTTTKGKDIYEYSISGSTSRLQFHFTEISETGQKPVILVDGTKTILSKVRALRIAEEKIENLIVAEALEVVAWNRQGNLDDFLKQRNGLAGTDSTSGLVQAIECAHRAKTSIVWLHGPLPLYFQKTLELEQILDSMEPAPRIVTLQLEEGLNTMIADIRQMPYFWKTPMSGEMLNDMDRAMKIARMDHSQGLFLGGRPDSQIKLYLIQGENDTGYEASHPYRLYIFSQTMQSWYASLKADSQSPALARLVTPVSGAVVLENQQQYKEANLDPDLGSKSIPGMGNIPEPGTLLLLILGIVFVFYRKFLPVEGLKKIF